MTGKIILWLLILIIIAAAAFFILKIFLSEDIEREKKWNEYQHRG